MVGVWLVAALAPASAWGFGTVNVILGQKAEHERITRAALRPQNFGSGTMDVLAGSLGKWGAVGKPDDPMGYLSGLSEAHCDNGDSFAAAGYPQTPAQAAARLGRCRIWIKSALDAAVTRAGGLVDANLKVNTAEAALSPACRFDGTADRAKCSALEQIGQAFHAAQDFYSHTNWVDAPGGTTALNPPGLNNTVRAAWLDPRIASPTFPAGLISGCYEGFPEGSHCTYGSNQPRVRHAVLNKDKGDIDPVTGVATGPDTDRGKIGTNFARAVTAAISDTRDKWAYVEEALRQKYGDARGRKIACVLRSDSFGGC